MPLYTDQLNRQVKITNPPRRIVSLVPSQTELLAYLELDEAVVGITKFCVRPDTWFREKTRVGGTKQLHTKIIQSLQPDLIIANKEENVQAQVETLEGLAPVWVSDINTLDDAIDMIGQLGSITGTDVKAQSLINTIRIGLTALQHSLAGRKKIRAIYLLWKDPYMTTGGDTFIHHMMEYAGLENIFAHETRYPVITTEMMQQAKPDLVLLSSEPYPFGEKQVRELAKYLPETKLLLADGEMFSWYGSRLQYAAEYLQKLHTSLV